MMRQFYLPLKVCLLALPLLLGSQATFAWHYDTVQAAANELSSAASHTHRQAERESHHSGTYEARALRALHTLDNAARHLRRQVVLNPQNARHSWQDYNSVRQAFYQAERWIHYAHFTQHVMRDWYRVENAFNIVQNEYGDGQDHGDDDDHNDGGHGGGGHGGGGQDGGWWYPRRF